MERTLWTDERLNDRFDSLDRTMQALRDDIAELRREMHNQFLVLVSGLFTVAGMLVAAVVARAL